MQSRTRHRAARPRFRSRSRPNPPTANTSIQNTIIDNIHKTLLCAITSPPSARLMSIIMSPTPLPNWSRMSTAPVTTCGGQRVSEQTATDTRCDGCKQKYMIHSGMSLSRARTNTHTHARAHTHTLTLSHTHLSCLCCRQRGAYNVTRFRVRISGRDCHAHRHVAAENRVQHRMNDQGPPRGRAYGKIGEDRVKWSDSGRGGVRLRGRGERQY